MKGYIDGKDFVEMEPMKYWSVPASQAASQQEIIKNAIYSGDYMAALKVDGYYQRIVKDEDGECFMIARSKNVKKEVVNKIEWLPQIKPWLAALPNGTSLLCECYLPGNEGSKNITTILGCLQEKAIKRQENNPLHLYVFDCVAFKGKSLMKTPYEERSEIVRQISHIYPDPYIEYATYVKGADIWPQLQIYLAQGREGMVLMRKDAIVYEKRTPARVSIKVKKELAQTIDAFVIGANPPTRIYTGKEVATWPYWEDAKTGEKLQGDHYLAYSRGEAIEPVTKSYFNDWCGSWKLGLFKDGHVVHIGDVSGLTDEQKANWKSYLKKVVEIGGMEILPDTLNIRHPKLLQIREDKNPRECLYSQLQE